MNMCTSTPRPGASLAIVLLAACVGLAAPTRYAQVNSARGDVKKLLAGQKDWKPVKVADKLLTGDQLRTGKTSTAILRLDGSDSSLVYVGPNTLMHVTALTTETSGGRRSQLRVDRGRARAKIRPLTNKDSAFRISTPACMGGVRGTEFALTASQEGLTAIGVPEGAVAVSAAGAEVALPAGTMNRTKPGEPPGPAEPLPESLDLVLDEPAKDLVTNQRQLELTGRTAPGASLTMNGDDVLVAEDGAFRLTVTLEEGENTFVFGGIDVAGNTARAERKITLDTKPPRLRLD